MNHIKKELLRGLRVDRARNEARNHPTFGLKGLVKDREEVWREGVSCRAP